MGYKKQFKKNKVSILFSIVLLLSIVLTFAIPGIIDSGNPGDGDTIASSSASLSFNISEANLGNATFNWNGTNYTAYNSEYSLRGFCNMDNRSSLGENDTNIHCWNDDVGYNITPTNAVPVMVGGKYNGGYYFDGDGDYLNMGSVKTRYSVGSSPNNNSFTMGMWIKRDEAFNVGKSGIFDMSYNFAYQGFKYTYEPGFMACFSRYGGCPAYAVNFARDTWYHVVIVKNDTGMISYLNGINRTTTTPSGNITNMTFNGNILIGRTDGGNYHNGTIDDFFFYNESLNSSEILDLYNAQLTKHNNSAWSVNSVQSITTGKILNSTDLLDDPFTYYSCATDSSGSENCTDERTVMRTILSSNIIANFTTLIGNVNNYFYGTNDQYNQLANNTDGDLDNDCDGTLETTHNVTRHRTLFEDAGMNHIRIWVYDLGLISLSEGVYSSTRIRNLMDTAEYANSIGAEVTFVSYGTPTWLANTTVPEWCNDTNPFYQSVNASCPPTNHTKLAIIQDYIIENLTQVISEDKINFIPYNEPWWSFFLDKVSTDNITKATEFGKIYNASYDLVKVNHPDVEVGWSMYTSLQTDVLSDYMMSNFSNKMDFVGKCRLENKSMDIKRIFGRENSSNDNSKLIGGL